METLEDPAPTSVKPKSDASGPDGARPGRRRRWLLIGLGVIVLGLMIFGIIKGLTKPAKKTTTITINTQTLNAGTLQQLQKSAGPSGQTTERLVITPDTLFKNSVEVEGLTALDKSLAINGNVNLTGNLSVTGLITGASLSLGSLTINNLRINGDLNFTGHVLPTGTAPTIKTSVGAAGGTATVTGNDTDGTVTITEGNSSIVAGEMAIISFHNPYPLTPRVQLTPSNPGGASLGYFATAAPGFFAIETVTKPTAGTTYTFNYWVTE